MLTLLIDDAGSVGTKPRRRIGVFYPTLRKGYEGINASCWQIHMIGCDAHLARVGEFGKQDAIYGLVNVGRTTQHHRAFTTELERDR